MSPWGTMVREFGPRLPTHIAVRDSASWAAFWSPPVGYGDRPAPPVDFSRETVLVFAEGHSSASSDPPPEYRGARRIGDTLVVEVQRKEHCGPGTNDIIHPMAVGRVPRHVGPVVFDFEIVPCRKEEAPVQRRLPAQAILPDVFPAGSWTAAESAESLGWSTARVAALRPIVDSLGSRAFMIVTRGRVVVAWGDTARTFRTHSVRKSFMSALIGMAVAEDIIDSGATLHELHIEEKVALTLVERQATVGNLLRARSGIYLPAAGENAAMRNLRPQRGSHAPGTHWFYNNWDFNVLGTIFRRETGEDIFEAIDRRIAKPLGMQDYRIDEGSYGLEEEYSLHPSYTFRISARDLARFGVLYVNRGRWGTNQLIPATWVDASVQSYSPSGDQGSRTTHSGYGFLWWIQSGGPPELRLPHGSFTASGLGGQLMTVIPEMKTVVVNMMNTDEPGPRISADQWDRLLEIMMAARLP